MRLRDLVYSTFVFGAVVAMGFACSKPECERNSDCGAGLICTTAGVCEMRPFRPPGEVPDAGPGMLRDLGLSDTGTSTPTPDAGDAGVDGGADAADAGDGGPDLGLPDLGPLDGGVVRNEGLITVTEYATGAAPNHIVLGRFIDDAASGVITYERTFGSGQIDCTLTKQVRPASLIGFGATRIEISGFSNGAVSSIELLPTGPGVFQTSQVLGAGLFLGSPDALVFEIESTNAAGNLASYSTTIEPPTPFAPAVFSPGIGTTVYTQVPPINVSWSPSVLEPGLEVHLELVDAPGAIRLSCTAPDGLGALQIPPAALTAFLAENPTPGVTMELRYQSEVTETVPIVGRASGIPTRFRAASGVLWPVQL